jgi:hypothetical protein
MPRMLFIVGRGRSGTTLLARLLTQHSAIAVAPEGTFALGLRRVHATRRVGPGFGVRFVRDLLRERRMLDWHLAPERLAGRLQSLPPGAGYAEACRTVYASYAEDTLGRPPPAWLGDKNPHYALFTRELAALFPEARFVHVTRDPRDNLRSYRQVDFDLGDEAALAFRWRRYNERVLEARARMPERFVQVRFEALLAEPARELSRVLAHLDLELEPSMLSAREPGPRLSLDVRPGWFQAPLGPVDATRARAAAASSPRVRHAADAICGALAERLGYVRRAPPPPLARLRLLPGVALGALSVAAEDVLLGRAPLPLRAGVINAYRRAHGRR